MSTYLTLQAGTPLAAATIRRATQPKTGRALLTELRALRAQPPERSGRDRPATTFARARDLTGEALAVLGTRCPSMQTNQYVSPTIDLRGTSLSLSIGMIHDVPCSTIAALALHEVGRAYGSASPSMLAVVAELASERLLSPMVAAELRNRPDLRADAWAALGAWLFEPDAAGTRVAAWLRRLDRAHGVAEASSRQRTLVFNQVLQALRAWRP